MLLSKPLLAAPARLASSFILISVLLDMAGLGISITVLPQLIGSLAGSSAAGWINGAFVGVWALVQFAASPLLGSLSDRFGRRPLLLISMLGLGLDYVFMALAPNLAWLLVGRILSGITASSFSISFAYVADVTPEEGRAAAFGRLGAAFGLGFILGPAVGGLLGEVSVRAPFWAAAGFSLANAVFGFLVLPESLPKDRRSPFAWRKANPLGSLELLRSHPELAGLSWTHLASQFAGSSIASVYVLYVIERYGWSMRSVGFSLAFVGVVVAVVQGGLQGRVTAWLGEKRTLLIGLAAGVLSLLGFGLSPAGWFIPVLIMLFGFWGLQGPATMAIMSRRVAETEQGRLQGAVASLTSLADGIGPFVFGGLFSLTAAAGLRGAWSGLAFIAAAALLLASLIYSAILLRVPKGETPPLT
ncbi:TCR/Tet family MFS transporter [soil metagenome]